MTKTVYDAAGNAISVTDPLGHEATSTYDAADELTREITPGPDVVYAYDANGNEIRDGSARYTYNLENEPTVLKKDGVKVASYAYTGDGLVATKITASARTSYSWDSNASLPELALEKDSQSGSVLRAYSYGQGPLELQAQQSTLTYHADSLGSVVGLTDTSGNEVASYRYSPYGEDWPSAGSSTPSAASNPIRFAGQYLDSDSGLYDLRAREYDPTDGRFLEVDPEGTDSGDSDLSAYLYAEDDPTLLTDPSGLDPCIGGATLSCKHNSYLCKLIYATGYKDGCKGQCVKNTLITLGWRGIDFNHYYAAAIGEGKIVNASDGPKGPGIYFVHGKAYLIKPPSGTKCGLACALGKGTTVALGCNSTATCGAMGALIVLPGIAEARAAARAEVAGAEAVAVARGGAAVVRIGQEGEAAVRAVEDIGPKKIIDIVMNGVRLRSRIPDGITTTTLNEVKNVKSLSFTQQLRDFLYYAEAQKPPLTFQLWTRSGTKLSGPLEEAVNAGRIVPREIPGT